MADKCVECIQCYEGRGCFICHEHRGVQSELIRCKQCRRSYCKRHSRFVHDIIEETFLSKTYSCSLYCDACNQSDASAMESVVSACYMLVRDYDTHCLDIRTRAYIQHRTGHDLDFFKLEDDAKNDIRRRIAEYNMLHVRGRLPFNQKSTSLPSSTVSSPQRPMRHVTFASPQPKKLCAAKH